MYIEHAIKISRRKTWYSVRSLCQYRLNECLVTTELLYILFTYFKIMYMFTVQFWFLFITPFYPLSPFSNLKEKKHFSCFPHDFMPALR